MEGQVTIKLDRERKLFFDINTIAEVDDLLRSGVVGLLRGEDWRVSDARTLLWAGLKADDPTITLARAGDLIQAHLSAGGMLWDIVEPIRQAFVAAGFLRQEKKRPDPPASPSPTLPSGSDKPSKTPMVH